MTPHTDPCREALRRVLASVVVEASGVPSEATLYEADAALATPDPAETVAALVELVEELRDWGCECDEPEEGEDGTILCMRCRAHAALAALAKATEGGAR